jgi:SAM-dependent methyltransferase
MSYKGVYQKSAEDTGFKDKFFDNIFCWATFDVMNQKKGLVEINRILKRGGKFLVTGKSDNYYPNDILAFNAEKNACLKNFPSKFTNLNALLGGINSFGFALDRLFLFPYRGDFGLLKYKEVKDYSIDESGYEYLIICEKMSEPRFESLDAINIERKFSKTSITLAKKAHFKKVEDYFSSIGLS